MPVKFLATNKERNSDLFNQMELNILLVLEHNTPQGLVFNKEKGIDEFSEALNQRDVFRAQTLARLTRLGLISVEKTGSEDTRFRLHANGIAVLELYRAIQKIINVSKRV